jgi:CubicO group peptidase (beta-lactamase class C family)
MRMSIELEPVNHAERVARIERDIRPAGPPGSQASYTMTERLIENQVPAVSVALIHDGQIAWARAWGEREAGGGLATADTLFQAASISKFVTAIGALRLVEAGTLDLDSDVNEVLRSWRVPYDDTLPEAARLPVTVRGLLSHTAGLTVHGFPGYARDAAVPSLLEVLNGSPPCNTAPVRVTTEPGTEWRYSGGGYSVLQLLMIEATDTPFPTLMRNLILLPLGMERSTFEQPLPGALHPQAATAHGAAGKPIAGSWHVYPEMAAAGLWTTPSDLARCALGLTLALRGEPGAILSGESVRAMFTPPVPGDYGLGSAVHGEGDDLKFGHGGSNEGFRCELITYADGRNGAAVMTNADAGGIVVTETLNALAREYEWPGYIQEETRIPVTVEPRLLERYVGEYELEPGFVVVVRRESEHLLMEIAGQPATPLYAASDATFFSYVMPGTIEFDRIESGQAGSMALRFGSQVMSASRV